MGVVEGSGFVGWEILMLLVFVMFWVTVAVVAYWVIRSAVRAGVLDAHHRLDDERGAAGPVRPAGPANAPVPARSVAASASENQEPDAATS